MVTAIVVAIALSQRPMQYSAKLVLEDGSPLTTSPQVFADCQVDVFRNGTIVFVPRYIPFTEHRRDPDVCEARFILQGFRSMRVTLRDGAVVVMKRLGEHEGSSVSITTLNAPAPARQAYDRGNAAMRRNKYAEAEKYFGQATAEYPAYAVAWSELGTALEQQGRVDKAREAYEKASAVDPKYIKPLVQLEGLQARQKRWMETVQAGERALALNPIDFPGAYFYYALASYQLGRMKQAEDAARKCIDADPDHEFARAYMVLGATLVSRGELRSGVDAFETYVRLAPRAEDAQAVRKRIEELRRQL